ncbi:porphobilinogen synthase, partial [Candidatus Pelagibacter bacterium]|nr:porphobilinogen synthase [Candidatus Pelagibacter bacterium]
MITGKFPNLRLRRSRKYAWSRRLVEENSLSSNDFILPIFLIDGKNKTQSIKTMPGVYRYTIDKLGKVVSDAIKSGIPMIALFPSTSLKKKNDLGTEALNEDNLVCQAIQFIKKRFKNEIGIMCDVALDPYTSHGHDGLLKSGYVLNDQTINILVKQSLLQAEMGCNVIAPSDMMDGRVGKIRKALDKEGYQMVQILSYAVKYASNFYGPFRDAVGSNKFLKSDKKNYQMDFRNSSESIREVALDIKEGADLIMVKPGMPYLDVIKLVKDSFKIPVFAYQVSGEYSIIKLGVKNKLINNESILE